MLSTGNQDLVKLHMVEHIRTYIAFIHPPHIYMYVQPHCNKKFDTSVQAFPRMFNNCVRCGSHKRNAVAQRCVFHKLFML